jgi:hypothetical protein
MRRAAVLMVLVLGLTAGCTSPSAGDGDVVDDWAAPSAPVRYEPKAGDCWALPATGGLDVLVPCDATHYLETVHVGRYTGAAAEKTPPEWYTKPSRNAYQACDDKAKAYLGDFWQAGRLQLSVVRPSGERWQEGVRTYRCDLRELDDRQAATFGDLQLVQRTASLRGALKGSRELGWGCYLAKVTGVSGSEAYQDDTTSVRRVDCARPHNLEYAGLFRTTQAAYPEDGVADTYSAGCLARVALFTEVPLERYLNTSAWLRMDEVARSESSHPRYYGRCFVWQKTGTVKGSRRG